MKVLFLLLTLVCCLSFIGSKNQVRFPTESEYTEHESRVKLVLDLVPVISALLTVPVVSSFIVTPEAHFSFSFTPLITTEICSQGPPVV